MYSKYAYMQEMPLSKILPADRPGAVKLSILIKIMAHDSEMDFVNCKAYTCKDNDRHKTCAC